MFISILSNTNKFYHFEITLERKFNVTKDKFDEIMNSTKDKDKIVEEVLRITEESTGENEKKKKKDQ